MSREALKNILSGVTNSIVGKRVIDSVGSKTVVNSRIYDELEHKLAY